MLPAPRHRLRVLVTGGAGMLARALVRVHRTGAGPGTELVLATRADADLRDPAATRRLVERAAPDAVIHAAARVGGIRANAADRAGFLLDNAAADASVFAALLASGVPRLVYLGSSCAYPRDHRQPLVEEDLLAGPLEPTNEGYALAKLAGTRMCRFLSEERGLAYRAVVASNLYGPGDDLDPRTAHLVAAALGKVHAAHVEGRDEVVIWGDGTARREFTYVDDLARWLLQRLPHLDELPPEVNAGAGRDHSVDEYYEAARSVVGYRGRFVHDAGAPAGMHRKLMDSTRARVHGWAPTTSIEDGMAATYRDLLERRGAAA